MIAQRILQGVGILAEFPSVIGATECAVEIQTVMTARNEDDPEHRRMSVRRAPAPLWLTLMPECCGPTGSRAVRIEKRVKRKI